ncbi:hypothetical protein [Streptomyces sp. NPDC058045]|uniref:hypothetical protein n=1 Tax=Streptomyces sp. NPDC058045 TaxID=3346311 RepID=UPI0036E216BA
MTKNRSILSAGRRRAAVAGVCAALALGGLTACGDDQASGAASVPDGWGTLKTKGADVSYPKGADGYTPQSAADRSKYNAAAAQREQNGSLVSLITVQLDFTNADSAAEAAIGAEAGVQLGSTVKSTKDIALSGAKDAKRIDFEFGSSGEQNTPPKGTRVTGVILTGLDSHQKTFAVRIDAKKGLLSASELDKIIDSVEVH